MLTMPASTHLIAVVSLVPLKTSAKPCTPASGRTWRLSAPSARAFSFSTAADFLCSAAVATADGADDVADDDDDDDDDDRAELLDLDSVSARSRFALV